jgi:putative membrane protein
MKHYTQGLLLGAVILTSLASVSCSSNGHWSAAWGKQTSETPPNEERNAADNVPEPVSFADREFAVKAAQGGMAEVELGALAQKRGSSEEVKAFGKQLVDNHTMLDNELRAIAAKHGIELPPEAGTSERQAIARLSKLSGARFDHEFIQDFAEGHHDDIVAFRKEAAHGTNPALKEFASESLATLQAHHTACEKMAATPGK